MGYVHKIGNTFRPGGNISYIALLGVTNNVNRGKQSEALEPSGS